MVQAALGVVLTPTVASELRGAGDVKVVNVTLILGGAAVGAAVLTGVGATVLAGVAFGAGVGVEVGTGEGVAEGDGEGALVGAWVAVGVFDAAVASADWLVAGVAEGPDVMEPGVAPLALHAPNVSAATTTSAIGTRRMALPPSTEFAFVRNATVPKRSQLAISRTSPVGRLQGKPRLCFPETPGEASLAIERRVDRGHG
jgi:hypothetical protein